MVRLPGDPHRLARVLAAGQVRRPSIRIGPSAAAIVGVSLVIALVAGAVLLAQITGQIRRDADARMDADAASATRDLAGSMASATGDLRLARRSSVFETALADTSGQLLAADRPEIEAAISYLGERYGVDEICLIRSSGLEAARWVRTTGLAPVDDLSADERANNPAVLPALRLADDATYETEPYVSPDSKRWVIGIATPIVEPDGAITGVLHAEIPIASMAEQLAALPPSGEGFGILVDRDGRLLVHPDLATFRTAAGVSPDPDAAPFPLATVAGSESWRSAVSRMLSGSAGAATYDDSGRTFRLSFVPVPGSSRILGLVEPTDSLYADVNRTILNVAATVAPILLLMAVVTLWFTRRMTGANRSLTRLNQRLSTANADLEGASRVSAEIARESAILNRFTELTALTEDDVSLSQATLATLDELVHPTDGSLHVSNQSQDRAIPQAALGGGPDRVLSLHELARCPAIRRSSLFVTDEVAHRLAFKCPVYPVASGTLACVPLVALGETVGAIHLHWEDGRELSLESRLAITRISEHSALSIANRRLLLALRGQANTDGRTGLTNSRAFDEIVERRLASRGSDGRAAVLMLDIDHFKDFNDRFGHPAGDEALRAFAHLLAASVRDVDVAARYGGEEFALFLDGLDGPAAAEIAERIRVRAEATIIALGPGKTGRITVSIGVATTPGHGTDRAGLLRSADAALYQAKLAGRNRVVLAGAPGPSERPDRRRTPRTRRSAA